MRAFRSEKCNLLLGLSAEWIAEVCQVHISTARRWKRGEEPPHAALILLDLRSSGNLGVIDPAFTDWRIGDGKVLAPDGSEYRPGDILAATYWRALAKSYQTSMRLPQQADWVSGEWTIHAQESSG